MRFIVFLVYLGSFILALAGVVSIPDRVWSMLTLWEIATVILALILSFCGVLVSFWLYRDNIEIGYVRDEIDALRNEIHRLEKQIRRE